MSKQSIEAGQQNASEISPPPPEEKVFVYHQDRIDVKSLYLATKLADVHFAFDLDDGTAQRIPAHKNLLVVSSDVFEKMFCGELKENGDVKIVDASAAAFEEFLQFFYLNDVKLSAKHLANILYLGNKYNVEKCIDACVKFLTNNLSNENVCIALTLAILHEQQELTEQCEERIMLNTADIFKSAGFLECSKGVMAHILQMNLLSCTEVEVFEACMRWVRAKSGQQVLPKATVEEHLGDLYYQIRFASITFEEFCALKAKYNAVLSNDIGAIVDLIGHVETHVEHFNKSPRQVKWMKDAILVCDRDCLPSVHKWQALDIEDKTIFSTNVPLLLGEFACDGIRVGAKQEDIRSLLSIEVKITEARALDDTNVKVLCSMRENLGAKCTDISLPHPILIRPGYIYTICMKEFPDGHYFDSWEQVSSVTLKSNIEIQFYNGKADVEKISGLIFSMQFNEI